MNSSNTPSNIAPVTSAQPVRDDFRVEHVPLEGASPSPLTAGTLVATLFMGLATMFSTTALSVFVVSLARGRLIVPGIAGVVSIVFWAIIPMVVMRRWWRSVRAEDRSAVSWSGLLMPFFFVAGVIAGALLVWNAAA